MARRLLLLAARPEEEAQAGIDVRLETIEGVGLVKRAAALAEGSEAAALSGLVAALDADEAGSARS